ncbi:MAG: xanthine dehydrogenase family protein molybdopterin-binding subunit [Proteobacteria bacterium]|nr:xanthine dehydrogenase family protein molybdopterin-binding subunit [Pseudomonadota bacterium]
MPQITSPKLNRREFIATAAAAGGGLALGFHMPARRPAAAQTAMPIGAELNAWLMIGTDDTVVIRVHRSEMGQGSFTAIPQLVAEELECDWSKVKAEFVSANRHVRENRLYVNLSTGGSTAIRGSHQYLRKAGATAREMLIQAAAQGWSVPAGECAAEKGFVVHKTSGRKINFGAVAEAAAKLTPPADVKFKPHTEWKIAGQSFPRFDVPSKVDGSAVFGLDVKVPDMVYAAVMTCPVFGGKVKSYDEAAIKGRKGVIGVVPIPSGVAVVAEHYWQARTALDELSIEWDEGENAKVSSATIHEHLVKGTEEAGAKVRHEGNFDEAFAKAAKKVEAEYHVPFLDHACMEPMNCTARVSGGEVEVWVSTQNAEAALATAAEAAGVPPDKAFVHLALLGGGFGRRGRQDYVAQAVLVAKAINRPVKLVWSREEDIRHGFYRPISMGKLRAGLDDKGVPVAYAHKVVGQSIFAYLLPQLIKDGWDRTSMDGTFDQPYKIPNVKFDYVMRNTHVPVGFWRSVGSSGNAFITESFIDELAHAAGKDPVEFRRAALVGETSWLNCLNMAAEKADWGKPLPKGYGRGIAINQSFGSICSHAAEVSVDEQGRLRVHRVVVAIDCGYAVNPDNIAAQLESCVVYGLSALLYGEITIKDGRVEQGNFDDYEVIRLDQMPKVEVHLSLTQGSWWGGVGEPGLASLAPAVCNAIFQATGRRVRSLPLKNHDLRSA